ncbi:MAG TPA: cyclic nucleotide-binding domain-containing protein [Candidatus Angelobacter sp.]|jgi:CRP-like cAMP-binding protein
MRKALHLLGILDDVDIDWMASNGVVCSFASGETLIHEKHPIDSLYLLLEGQMSVTVGGSNGTFIATLLPGEIIGEISFVDARPPLASVRAVEDSRLLAISRESISMKLVKDQAFAARFYKAIAVFLADRLYVTVGRFGYGSAQQDVDELPDYRLDEIDLAAVRTDQLLKRLRSNGRIRNAG